MAPRKMPRVERATTRYPSLREHLATRRRFLGVAGASLAAGALHAACQRSLGAPGEDDAAVPGPDAAPPQPDGAPPQHDTGPIPGAEPEPNYFIVRIPVTGELSAHLLDEGYAQFYVEVLTYVSDSADALWQNMAEAEEACRQVVSDFTYDQLDTAAGVLACEEELLTALDDLVMQLEGHALPTVEQVTATFTYLEPYTELSGAAEPPSYP